MYQKGIAGKFLTHTYNICKTWGSEPSNNRAETRSHSAVQENFSQQARAIMFQNPNDPCNFCLGGQCDSQSPGKAIRRLSTRAPNPPPFMVGLTGRIITAVQYTGNQKPTIVPPYFCLCCDRTCLEKASLYEVYGSELEDFSHLYEVHHNFTRRRIQQASQGTQVISPPPLPPCPLHGVVSSPVVGRLWSMEYEGYAGYLGLSRDWKWRCIRSKTSRSTL